MRRYIIIASALLASAAVHAQNLNPTVQVTNDYEGKLMEVEKRGVDMAVPDSLLKFDWNFNYEVFDNPYKGAYEFSPYRIDMKPDPTRRDNGSFYLRAGAGYSLHPEAQVVFTPATKGRFGVSVYDDFKGYAGKYHDITALPVEGEPYSIAPDGDYTGSDFANRLGTTLRYDSASSVITLDGGFNLLRTGGYQFGRNRANGGSATLRARSIGDSDLLYDVSLGWNGLSNKVGTPVWVTPGGFNGDYTEDAKYVENDLGFDASFGFRLAESHTVGLEPSWHHTVFSENLSADLVRKAFADRVEITPYYRFSDDGFSVRVGIRFADVWRDADFEQSPSFQVADYKGRKLFPDFLMNYEAIPDNLVLSAKVTGGQSFNTYGSYLYSDHHLPQTVSSQYLSGIGDATVNTFDAGIGASGRVKSIFQYAVAAGFARYYNAPLDGILAVYSVSDIYSSYLETAFYPTILMMNYDLLYTDLEGNLATDRLDGFARIRLQAQPNSDSEKGMLAMSLPVFTGSAGLVYNWNRRVFAGVDAEWASGRDGEAYVSFGQDYDCHAPGWVDLGVTAEFKANNHFSLWAQGRNLLNQTVMRSFMIAEKGPWFTAGISLNF